MIVREPEEAPIRSYDLGVTSGPFVAALTSDTVREHIINRVFEGPHDDAVSTVMLSSRDSQRVQAGVGMKQHLCPCHDCQSDQLGIAPLVANDRCGHHAIEFKQRDAIARTEEAPVGLRELAFGVAMGNATFP